MLQLTREQVRKWVKENYPNVPTLLSSIYGTAEDIERSGVSQLRELDRKRLEQIKERAIEAVIAFMRDNSGSWTKRFLSTSLKSIRSGSGTSESHEMSRNRRSRFHRLEPSADASA